MWHRLALLSWIILPACTMAAEKLEYNRDIRPILAENCFSCHGPDSASRKAGLRLDQRDVAVEMEAILPGKSKESEIIARVLKDVNDDAFMPPKETNKKLTPEQINTLKKWIDQGAEYQPHWSFIAPVKVNPPETKNTQWAKQPLDRFILAELEKRKLAPAPLADKRTLIRRVSLDLTGLPPSLETVERIMKDTSPRWYENYIDELLASPQYGEHRARYWLDAARYGDTHGIHFDNYREIWPFRNWVIDAFNQNMPFDQFTREQLAGDLLPNATLDQQIATGFIRNNITTSEGGAIDEEYLVLYARDRTETFGQVWLGLTVGCAVCHDHKFDPVSMKDFYSLSAFFNNGTQRAMDGNIKDTPPILLVPSKEDRPRWTSLMREIRDHDAKFGLRKKQAQPLFDTWLADADVETLKNWIPHDGLHMHMPLNEAKGKTVEYSLDGQKLKLNLQDGLGWADKGKTTSHALVVRPKGQSNEISNVANWERTDAFSVSFWVKPTQRNSTGAVLAKMNPADQHRGWDVYMEGDRIGMHMIHAWQGNALKVMSKNQLKINNWAYVTFTYDGTSKAKGIQLFIDGVPQALEIQADSLSGTIQTPVHLQIGQRSGGDAHVRNVHLQDIRIYKRNLKAPEVDRLTKASRISELLNKQLHSLNPQEKNELFEVYLTIEDIAYIQLLEKSAELKREEAAIKGRGAITHVMQEKPGEPVAYTLERGEYTKRKEKVGVDVPRSLPPMKSDAPKNRLGLADWVMQPENPLTARVTVNRYWQELFGQGLVRTSGDFGITGELPSHPELLDFLAISYREMGWDTKKFFKMLLMSATYMQSAQTTPEKLEADPSNIFLSRGPRFRMDAEMIRDYALATSGLLVPKIGGPSVKPYQPEGVWEAVAMIGSNTRNYKRDTGENLYRRSMYTLWKRAAPPAAMEILNAPNRETCTVRRERTNTPLQALLTMNDEQFVEAHRVLAENLIEQEKETSARIQRLAVTALARPFREKEMVVVQETLTKLKAEFDQKPEDARKLLTVGERKAKEGLSPSEVAAWTILVNQVLNLDEVLCK